MFSLMWETDPKINIYTKQAWSHTNSDAGHVSNNGATPWNLGKEGKEKRMIAYQQYHKT
jgi:hypothetical protein